jgi:hypothetical protein
MTPSARLAAALDTLAPYVDRRALERRLGLSRGMLGQRLPTATTPKRPSKELVQLVELLAELARDRPAWLVAWIRAGIFHRRENYLVARRERMA